MSMARSTTSSRSASTAHAARVWRALPTHGADARRWHGRAGSRETAHSIRRSSTSALLQACSMRSMAADAPRRVLMTADTVGGVWTYALELARELVAHGVEVHIATMGGPIRASQRTNLPDVTLHESRNRLEWMQDCWDDVARASEWLMALEDDIGPEVVHLNQYAFGALPFAAPTVLV